MSAGLMAVYRHDVHKMRGRAHQSNADELNGIPINNQVPHGADRDAAALSRPSGSPDKTIAAHDTHYRLSLLTGETRYDPNDFSLRTYRDDILALIDADSAADAHAAWLDTDLPAAFNESVYYPTTSLKYHTLLVAALVDCYESGLTFGDLALVVAPPDAVVPHRTIYADDDFSLRLTEHTSTAPSAPVESRPCRSWASVWQRLEAHPLDTDTDRFAMALDAALRRIRSWSTALQYIEEFKTWAAEVER
jgi:hypothetical protein